MKQAAWAGLSLLGLLAGGCLHRGAPGIPSNAAVAVLPFDNHTRIAALGPALTSAVAAELAARTRYRIVAAAPGARATVQGSIRSITLVERAADGAAAPTVPTVEVTLDLQLAMLRADGRELAHDDHLVFHDRPDFLPGAADDAFFAQDSTAFPALCRRAAAAIVTELLAGLGHN